MNIMIVNINILLLHLHKSSNLIHFSGLILIQFYSLFWLDFIVVRLVLLPGSGFSVFSPAPVLDTLDLEGGRTLGITDTETCLEPSFVTFLLDDLCDWMMTDDDVDDV